MITELTTEKNADTTIGRRIVNVQFFIDQLSEICKHSSMFSCNLSNIKIISENRTGLESKFNVLCEMCNQKFVLKSDPDTPDENLNQQIVSAVISNGSGYSHLEILTAALSIPGISPQLYLRTQNKIFDWWEAAAVHSMAEFAKEEARLAILAGSVDQHGTPLITVIVDGCWSKRSYGKNYSALSGAAAIIGLRTGKVIFYGVKNKFCHICSRAEIKNIQPKEHQCYKNFSGPSTAMESSIIVEGFKKSVEMYGLIYNKFIGDGDSSTYKSILDARPYENVTVEKIECKNHLLRNYCNALSKLSLDTKFPIDCRKSLKERLLRLRVGVVKSIMHWKDQDLNISEKINNLAKDILNGPRHVFGDHKNCAQYFCKPETRRVESVNLIPSFLSSGLMCALERLSTRLSYHARSLICDVTSNNVESFNAIVAKFVGGKRINFCLRRSYAARCAAAVISFNTGVLHTFTHEIIFGKTNQNQIVKIEKFRNNKIKKSKKRPNISKTKPISTDCHYGENCEKPDLEPVLFEKAKKDFLDKLRMDDNERKLIERGTILQRYSAEWMERRRKLLTASNFGEICKKRTNTRCAPLVKKIIYGNNLSHLPSIQYGIKNEECALQQLSVQEKVEINACGLFIDPEFPFLGASPDGVYAGGIVEIKCPSSLANMNLDQAKAKHTFWKYDKIQNCYTINKNHNWFYQVQGQLQITKNDTCMFAIWFGENMPLDVYLITRDQNFWKDKMSGQLSKFYMDCVIPELIDPRVPRSLNIREPTYILDKLRK